VCFVLLHREDVPPVKDKILPIIEYTNISSTQLKFRQYYPESMLFVLMQNPNLDVTNFHWQV
jgi:hypothetical protein